MLENDAFWATNARFSNDEEEQRFGKEVIESVWKSDMASEDFGLDENYIICFCNEDDKLSQWRGYASEGGVSMGFDFGMPRAFSIVMKDKDKEPLSSENCIVQYAGLGEVLYINPKGQEDDDNYGEYCKKELELGEISTESEANYNEKVRKKAPYIKHSGFKEEDECRLVFHNNGALDACIRYHGIANEALKYPYIVVKAALPDREEKQCVVRVCIQDGNEDEIVKALEEKLEARMSGVVVMRCHSIDGKTCDIEEAFCEGCTLRRLETVFDTRDCRYHGNGSMNYTYTLPNKGNCVMISQGEKQENVFEIVHSCVEKYSDDTNKISVWCEGHLPLRTITVGPCSNQNVVVEAIKHYCKHKYWLRDVEIKPSAIPFRRSL